MDSLPFFLLGVVCLAVALSGAFMARGIYRNRHRGEQDGQDQV
ncbi:hypothetical protein SAMN05216456_1350 [Devosia crocina]|uniref:Uncharacterized protein n=1 Tax=Devosia crocina TaxID=429728 RepID=A0A1I7N9Z2_9HYPH|nr:hypothetical protein [Devosia crocina]SFV31468.1 hypothetical protein SAMN05216456_1350 [Devosia crocina]